MIKGVQIFVLFQMPLSSGDVCLAAEDGIDASFGRFVMKVLDTKHICMIGNGHGPHNIIDGLLKQLRNTCCPIQDGILGMYMQVTEIHFFRTLLILCVYCYNILFFRT